MRVSVELTPGDFLDRFAILMVKRTRLGTAFEDDCRRYAATAEPLLAHPKVRALFDELVVVHVQTFDALETAVPHAFNGGMSVDEHVSAIRLNRDRVRLKAAIDEAFDVPGETKSYYTERV